MRGPRVLHLLAPASDGGLERVVAMLAAGQGAERAHVAAVLEPHRATAHPFVDRLRALGVPVTPLVVPGRAYRRELSAVMSLARQLGAEVVHTHGYRADLLGQLAARRVGAVVVSTVHGFTGGGWRNRVYERLQCAALRRADAVVAVSGPIADRLAAAGVRSGRVHVVMNGFGIGSDPLARADARAALGIPAKARRIGWLGRVSREKGLDVMIATLPHLEDEWTLSVMGDGPERAACALLGRSLGVEARIVWHGAVADGGHYLRAFDAYVLSSRTEGTPIALLEAMYAGTPVVATAVGGVPDVLSGDAGLLVPAEDPGALAAAVARVAADPASATARAGRAASVLREQFAPEPWVRAIDDIYRGALGR